MIFATGDTHGNFLRFDKKYFLERDELSCSDHVIICGDFGGVWDGSKKENHMLDELDAASFTTLWVDGNHENYDRLRRYPTEEWHGGKVQRIRPNIIHLMRGQVYEIEGCTFFTMGGASSHDIDDGILNPHAPDFEEQYWMMRRMGARFRVNHRSWWKEELPSDAEYAEAIANLDRVNWRVDYVITHCAPTGLLNLIGRGYTPDRLTNFLDMVSKRLEFHYWLFGHYHDNRAIGQNYILIYEQIAQVI
ncbi:MAG: metallophosphoesterase family protein [Clostridiaceae bacterium]|nr:metallophosphoesterase family protein [Clostridiaceae bacterium]